MESTKLEISPGLSCWEGKMCSCGGIQRGCSFQGNTSSGDLPGSWDCDALRPLSVGLFSCVCLASTQTLPSGQAPESGLWRPYRLCLSLFPTWLHWQNPLFLLFAIILAPIIGLVRIYSWTWLVEGTEHLAPETSLKRMLSMCLKGPGSQIPMDESPTQVLETKLRSSGRAMCALNERFYIMSYTLGLYKNGLKRRTPEAKK